LPIALSTIKKTDYLLILHDGHVIEYGETKKLELDPQSEYSALLKRGGDLYE
jgi:ABC-type antimicrobial peptide transport system ATPase subunit